MGRRKTWVELSNFNGVVTDDYVRAIGDAFSEFGFDVDYTYEITNASGSSDDIYVVSLALSAYKLLISGRKNIVFWSQGVWPEESRMKHGSAIRYSICNHIEKKALVGSKRVFLVSRSQRSHYEKKYDISLQDKSYVMPCSNEQFQDMSFFSEDKYCKPLFAYTGSLAKYQCIDQMLQAFKQAQSVCPGAKLLFYTSQKDQARSLVESAGLRNVIVDYVEKENLSKVLCNVKYGFVIRDDSVVNRVATPTKISTYIANGVIPIYSASLEAFSESRHGIEALQYNKDTFPNDLLAFEAKALNANKMHDDYLSYFNRECNYATRHSEITRFLRGII